MHETVYCFRGLQLLQRHTPLKVTGFFLFLTALRRLTKRSTWGADTGRSRDIENDGEQQLKGWQKHLAKYKRGEAAPLLLNQAWDGKSSGCGNLNAITSHPSPSPSMNKQLRRVIMQYGLEYGPPAGPLLRIHHGPLRRHGKHVRRAAVAAVVSLAGIVCLGTASLGAASGNQSAVNTMGLAVGRKLLTFCKDPRTPWIKDVGTAIGYSLCSNSSCLFNLPF